MAAWLMSLATPPATSQVGHKAIRKFFDEFRRSGERPVDISDGVAFDWQSYLWTSWNPDMLVILEFPSLSATVAFNEEVRDPNRAGLQRLGLALDRSDGSRARLYPGAKLIIESLPARGIERSLALREVEVARQAPQASHDLSSKPRLGMKPGE